MNMLSSQGLLATEDFDQLCFEYGLELDEDVGCLYIPWKHNANEPVQTTAEVEAAIKAGLSAVRPVRSVVADHHLFNTVAL